MSTGLLTHPASPPQRGLLSIVSWALVFVWLASSAASFWFMELKDWRSFGEDTAFGNIDAARVEDWFRANSKTIADGSARTRLTLVYLYDRDCACNRYSEPHLQRLIEHYAPLGVKFAAATNRADAAVPFNLPALNEKHATLASAGTISSPAALIFDADGRLIYYGPYSDSAWCGSTGTLVEPVLDRALSGLAAVKRPRASRGCFCGW